MPLFPTKKVRRVNINVLTGQVSEGRHTGKNVERLAGPFGAVYLGTRPGDAFIVDRRKWIVEDDPYNFNRPKDENGARIANTVAIEGGWLVPA